MSHEIDFPDNWNHKGPNDDLRKKSERIFYSDDRKSQVEIRYDDEGYWYVKSIRANDSVSNIDGKEFNKYEDALDEVISRMEDKNKKGNIPREYLITDSTKQKEMVIKAFDEFEAATRFLMVNNEAKTAVVKEANQFGDETIRDDMETVNKIRRDIRNNRISKPEIIKKRSG